MIEELKRHGKLTVVRPPGNVGDEFIFRGMGRLFLDHKIEHEVIDPSSISQLKETGAVCWGGGGNVSGRYPVRKLLMACAAKAHQLDVPFICLPQSIEQSSDQLYLFDKVYLRDYWSLSMFRRGLFAEDLALSNSLPPSDFIMDSQRLFRADSEATGAHSPSDFRKGLSLDGFIELCGRAKHLETDMLHTAICAMKQGVQVTLHPCNWHKNKSVFQTSLHHYPNIVFKD